MTSSHAANLEAELGRLSATSQQLTAENDRLKQLKTAHAHEMETIVTALQRATGAAQSSTPEIGRRAKTKATIRRLEAELASRTAGPSPGFPPAAAPPVSLALAPRADTTTELRLGSSEMVGANLPMHATTPLPRDAGLSPPRSQVAPPPTRFRSAFPTLVADVSLAAARSCAELVQAAAQPATAARLLLLLQGEYREPAVAALQAAQHSVRSLLEIAASAATPIDARIQLLGCLTAYHSSTSKQLDPVAEREALSKCLGILAEPEANADLQAAARSLMCTARPEDIRDACVSAIRTAAPLPKYDARLRSASQARPTVPSA